MAIEYLKRAIKTATSGEDETRQTVSEMLSEIDKNREDAVKKFSKKLDNWAGPIVVESEQISAAKSKVSNQLKDDLKFAHERIRLFAEHQKASLTEFETELSPGLCTYPSAIEAFEAAVTRARDDGRHRLQRSYRLC